MQKLLLILSYLQFHRNYFFFEVVFLFLFNLHVNNKGRMTYYKTFHIDSIYC